MKRLSHRFFNAFGWQIVGEIPDVPKMVIIGAPHTSNRDFFLFLAALHHYAIEAKFLGKHTLFRAPLGFMFRKVGGIPVDRSKAGGVVAQVTAAFARSERMILVIAPEGTRGAAREWKSGFIEIAASANVPVVCAGVGPGRILTLSEPMSVGEDRTAFMDRVREFYVDKTGLRPEHRSPVRLRVADS